jgi:hypothetical protein
MSSIFKGKSWIYKDLCVPLDIHELYEPVFRQHTRITDRCITLRPLAFGPDDDIITECVRLDRMQDSPSSLEDWVSAEKDLLKAIADSDSGQTFLGLIDEQSVFLTGIHKSLQHPVSLNAAYKPREGDYFLTLKIPSNPAFMSMERFSLPVLQSCLIHYFSYPAVEKVIAIIDRNSLEENQEYGQAGFRLLCEIGEGKRLIYHHGKGYIEREAGGTAIPVNEW